MLKLSFYIGNSFETHYPHRWFSPENHGEGFTPYAHARDISFVQHRPLGQLEPLDVPVDRFLASVRFEHRIKLDQLAIEVGSLDTETGK
jgi:hypothetical protein